MPEKNDLERLNPQIMDVEIGVRSLRKITIYPLSMADQFKLSDIVTKAIEEHMSAGKEDIALVAFILNLLKSNIGRILEMATDEKIGSALLKEMTNMQAATIAQIVYDVNFGEVAKNMGGLLEKVKKLFLSGRPLPPSVNDTEDIASITSLDEVSEKEESPTINS
uniref:Uncharacterized protein n=1 Tax=viral metagenome TaxID=1070528 RepID=A0A6H1Z8G5_9ZZZZ